MTNKDDQYFFQITAKDQNYVLAGGEKNYIHSQL